MHHIVAQKQNQDQFLKNCQKAPKALRVLRGMLLIFLLVNFVVKLFGPVHPANAAGLTATPAILDLSGIDRDILQSGITLTNGTGHTLFIYPSVDNVSSTDGDQNFEDGSLADRTISLANWISFTRGVIVLSPGQKISEPLTVQVNPNAKVGIYHAIVNFYEGDNRTDAQNAGTIAQTFIDFEVKDDAHNVLNLQSFSADHAIFFKMPATVTYVLQNGGNRAVTPGGEIILYDHDGAEVSSIPVTGTLMQPDQTATFQSAWNTTFAFGSYKAGLRLEYGADQNQDLSDDTTFWVLPWQLLLIIIIVLVSFALFYSYWTYRQQLKRYAALRVPAVKTARAVTAVKITRASKPRTKSQQKSRPKRQAKPRPTKDSPNDA